MADTAASGRPVPQTGQGTPARAAGRTGLWAWAQEHIWWFALGLALVVAIFFRAWHIGSVPPGLFGDEAVDGLDALDVLAGRGAVFFPANFGREGLHVWLVAGMFRLLGVTPLAVRLPSVIAGIVTVLATYWLGVELVAAGPRPVTAPADMRVAPARIWRDRMLRLVPLVAALYLGASYFHVHYSRFGIRGVFTPLCGALAFAAFWRGVNRPGQRYPWFAISGVCLGLSLHFYTASRFYPVFLGGFLILQALISVARRRPREAILIRDFGPVVLLFGLAALVFAPLGAYFWQHPGSFAQRAAEVSAFKGGNAWPRIGQAALANVLQYFWPGGGDQAQFYNLPGRAVFDPLTAALALAGLAVLLARAGRSPALFLLLWWPALLLPSFLATDRFPTLPRVLGAIPGMYFFPTVGLLALLGWLGARLDRRAAARSGSAPLSGRGGTAALLAGLCIAAVAWPAALTYRDYFLVWAAAPATAQAFEADMTQAAAWLAVHPAPGHVYLSSDIYRHPTFMLLHERVPVSRYFATGDPNLSWFDAQHVLPLPPAGEPATYLISAATPPWPAAQAYLVTAGSWEQAPDPSGGPSMLATVALPGDARPPAPGQNPEPFTPQLALTGARWADTHLPQAALRLDWQTNGPDPAAWPGYRLQIGGRLPDGGSWQREVAFDDFRGPEWVPGGRFLTWRKLALPPEVTQLPGHLRLRLLRADTGDPVALPAAPDGWHTVSVGRP